MFVCLETLFEIFSSSVILSTKQLNTKPQTILHLLPAHNTLGVHYLGSPRTMKFSTDSTCFTRDSNTLTNDAIIAVRLQHLSVQSIAGIGIRRFFFLYLFYVYYTLLFSIGTRQKPVSRPAAAAAAAADKRGI